MRKTVGLMPGTPWWRGLSLILTVVLWAGGPGAARASLEAYDAAITNDMRAGVIPISRLTSALTLTGANRLAFDFGNVAGNATFEFILEGDPTPSVGAACLAVGTNNTSILRYEQWNNTAQLGFTRLTIADYTFSPSIASPRARTHLAWVWSASAQTMYLYVNGRLAASRAGVTTSFSMPTGSGFLGGYTGGGDLMTGVIYRLTVYGGLLPSDTIKRHADAYNDVPNPPVIASFTATPEAVFTPGSATLAWNVLGATAVFLDGAEVTGLTNRVVSPTTTTTYTLTATNLDGSVSAQTTVWVNPAPVIKTFRASRSYVPAGETTTLLWEVNYGQTFALTPGPGDLTAQTTNGSGAITVTPAAPMSYTLTAANAWGTNTAQVDLFPAQPANHPVISEFMADNASTLQDEDGDYPDWIELYNPTTNAINLAGYYLTDDEQEPAKWAFPGFTLPARGYLVVYASGKNRTNRADRLHTNFQLDKAGEYLALVGPGPVLAHGYGPVFPEQREDIAYGLLAGDVNLRRYLGEPTPGASNDEAPPRPARPLFSRASGMFTEPFLLVLTTPEPGAEIRYTLDGSTPGLGQGAVYRDPLLITNTVRVRAVAVTNGLVSRLRSAGYIRLAPDLAAYTSSLPILVIETFGEGAIQHKGWNSTGAGIKQVPRQAAFWATIERAGGVSALTNAPQMIHPIGIRGRGGASSGWQQKPYSVEAVDDTGAEEKVSPLGMPPHADWVLYYPDGDTPTSKDSTLLFNTFAYELSQNAGRYDVRFRWVEAFINEDGGALTLADRRGVYAILEKVSRGKDRLDFQKLSADGATGSWLLNINRMDPEPETGWPAPNGATQPWFFHTAGPNRIPESPPNGQVVGDDEPQQSNGYLNFDNPSGYVITPTQRAAIEGWFKQFEDVLWNNALWRDPVNGYRKYIDPVDFADYFVLNVLTKNSDGMLISLFPWKGDDGKLRMGPGWDYNWNSYYNSGVPTNALLHRSDRLWYKRLFADPDFLQLYIDRWWDWRRGAMSDAAMDAIIDRQAAEITAEKALLNGLPSATEWTNRLLQLKTWLKTRANWVDSNYTRPPAFDRPGGEVADGFQAVLRGTNGTIYFTLDGSDPRASGGAVAGSAQAYQAPITISTRTLISARVKNGTNWSGLTTALYAPPQDLSSLVISEIMYNPPAAGGWTSDDLEFLELKNTGTNALQLDWLTFTAGISLTFTNGTRLDPGQFLVLARNAQALQARYPGLAVGGVYTGRLDNAGETLRLSTPAGATILAVTYNDRAPWPLTADGHGFSLVPRSAATGNSDDGARWRASAQPGGSPGADDPPSPIAPVLINELLTHTDPPAVDAIELFNPNAEPADIGGWYLSDDGAAPWKYRIPDGTVIPANGYLVFTETNFNAAPGSLYNFALDSAGDALYLCSADAAGNLTGYSHGVSFGAAALGVSFGRYVNSVGEEQFPAQLAVTLGTNNAGPAIGPVVIQEIMYHPGADGDEFVELRNLTGDAVPLFDPAFPTNTWRLSGLGFDFPTNVILPAHGCLLVAATNPESFRLKYAVPTQVLIFGPHAGALQDSGERLELQRPDAPLSNGVPYVTVDAVRYNDKAPWPPGADGGGPSLQRRVPAAYGDDPANWDAALPTPGADFTVGQPPALLAQSSNVTLVAGQNIVFSVAAAGAEPLYYQWLFNGQPLLNETNAALALTNVQPAQAGEYRAVVYNAAGSVTSTDIRLSVLIPATIVSHPVSITTNAGRTVTFTTSALGTGALRYQWRLNGLDLPGATNLTLVITNVQSVHAGTYTVMVTDNIGSTVSRPATLVVLYPCPVVQSPLSQAVVPGSTFTLSVAVTNNATLPITYKWRVNFQYAFTNVRYAHADFVTITNAQPIHTNYSVVVTNVVSAGTASGFANIIYLADSDGDGLPDVWEEAAGLSATNAADALGDNDGDGMLNWQEYVAGTDPTNALSCLKVEAALPGPGAVVRFGAISNRTYSVQFSDQPGGPWTTLADLPARATNRVELLPDPGCATNRFYRVQTPRL